jgi:DNA-binding transcriptional ArsR family regulator
MSEDSDWTPASIQIVSDLGQLTAFANRDQSRILRILQRQEATVGELVGLTDVPASTIDGHVQSLRDLVLIRVVGTRENEGSVQDVYRATSLMFMLRPEPRDMENISLPMAVAILDMLSGEILTSLEMWPDQQSNLESRRTRLPVKRVMEFNDRLGELLSEFWGNPSDPIEENPDDPVMSFVGFWYRFPE